MLHENEEDVSSETLPFPRVCPHEPEYFEHGYTEAHTHIAGIKDLQTTLSTCYFPLCDTMLYYVFRSSKMINHES